MESAFVLIDRASGPIRSIRRELRELEVEARAAGRALDDLSGPDIERRLRVTSDEMDGLGESTHRTGQEMHHTERETHVLDRRVEHLGTTSRKSGLELRALGKTVGMLKLPAAIAAVGGLTQVMGGLASGALAAAPAVGRVTTVSAAAIPVMTGLGVSMATTKLATNGLSQALSGNEKALKALTPEGRAFLEVLRGVQKEGTRLQRTAQRNMFPGLTDGLGDVQSAIPTVNRIVARNSRDVGNLARFGGQQISANTSQGRQEIRDLTELADAGSRAMGAFGRSGMYVGRALTSVGVAAAPLTDWLGTSAEGFAKNAAEAAYLAQETGRMQRTFDRAGDDLERFGDIGGHVFGALRGGMRAASGAGDDLWDTIDHGAESWDTWMNSVEGQSVMRRWFDDTKPALKETVGLVGDLGEMIGHLSSGPEGASMLRALRDAMPSIEKGVSGLTATLGPAAIDAFGEVVELAGDLGGEAGPLTLVARAVGLVADGVDGLVQISGPLGPAIATGVGSFLLLKKMGVLGMLDTVRAKWQGVTVAEQEAAAAARVYATTSVGTGPGIGRTPVYNAAGRRALAGGAVPTLRPGETVTPNGLIVPSGTAAGAAPAALMARAAGGSRALGMLGTGAKAVGRFAWPLALGMGAFGALGTEGDVGDKLRGGLSAGTFGLVPRPRSDDELVAQGQTAAARAVQGLGTGESVAEQQAAVDRLRARAARQGARANAQGHTERMVTGSTVGGLPIYGKRTVGAPTDDQRKQLRAETAALEQELGRREGILRDSMRRQRQITAEASVQHAHTLTDDFATAFSVMSKARGPEKAMDTTVDNVLTKMRGMKAAGRKVLGENMLSWAREQARQNPALTGQVEQLQNSIVRKFRRTGRDVSIVNGEILTGSRREWRDIRTALTTQTERARQDVSDDFTAMQRQALGSLTAMGFSRSDAKKLVSDVEKGGKAGKRAAAIATTGVEGSGGRHESVATREKGMRARGGRMPGFGRHDTVPMADGGWGAPGELVVNGHSERDDDAAKRAVNGLLGKLGVPVRLPTIAERVAAETRPHSMAPTRATGGRVGGVQAGVASAAEKVLGRFPGLSITSTTGGGHAAGSYHYKGQAVDIGGPQGTMDAAAAWIRSSMGGSLAEGIHNPGLSIKDGRSVPSSFWGGATWAGHANHIHLAIAGALGALQGIAGGGVTGGVGGGQIQARKSRGSKVGGLPGAAATAAGGLYAAGLTKKLNDALGSMGGAPAGAAPGAGGAGGAGSFSFGGSSWNEELARIAASKHWSAEDWRWIVQHESGGNPNARNPSSGATGLGQMLGGNVAKYNGNGSPVEQIEGMGRYIADRYGSPTAAKAFWESHNWYAKGGRLAGGPQVPDWGGWNAKGGDYEVNRPTLFGAGEAGKERVTITPKAASDGGRARIVLAPQITIKTAGGKSVTKAWVHREFERFARDIARELDGDIEESEEELMA